MKNYIKYSYLHWAISLVIGVGSYSAYKVDFKSFIPLLIYALAFSLILVLIPLCTIYLMRGNKYVRYIHLMSCIVIIYITFFTMDDPDNDYLAGLILIVSSTISTFILRNKFVLNDT